MKPTSIIIHHSFTKDSKTVSWNAIRNYHILHNKWRDIGYHYGLELVGDNYEIFKGRMDNETGAHCLGFNDSSIGICVVGNFDHVAPNRLQLGLLEKLVLSLMEVHNIPRTSVYGHWETYEMRGYSIQKSCPGNAFSMPLFRNRLYTSLYY